MEECPSRQIAGRSFPEDASSDGIHFNRLRGVEWLNNVFQRHISALEADLLETAHFTFGPPPNPPFLATRPLSSRLGARVDSRYSSRSSRTRLPGSTPMEAEEAESSTPQSSVVSSVVVVDNKRVERPAETSRLRYLEKVKELDLEDLECRQEFAVAAAEKQREAMVSRLTQEKGRWPFLTPRLENATDKTRESAPPLVKQIWEFLEKQLEVAESREMTVGRFVTAANEVTIGGFWREHAKGELRTRKDHEILKFLSPCWEKKYMAGVFCAKETIFGPLCKSF